MVSSLENKQSDVLNRVRKTGLRRRWWIVLLALCLIAIGAYVFFIKQEGAARKKQTSPSPGIQVVAVAAKKSDINVYLTGRFGHST